MIFNLNTTSAARSSFNEDEEFEQQLGIFKEMEQYNKRSPTKCPTANRAALLQNAKDQLRMQKTIGNAMPRKAWISGTAHCCTKPLSELKPIHFGQMKIPFVHEGHFLACRVLTEGNVIIATEVLVEDTKSHVHGVNFHNFTADLTDSSWLKPGTIALIKEPYMRCSLISKTPFIRVDSPSDVVFVHKTNRKQLEWAGALCWYEPETLSAEELKKRGNTAFVKKDFEDALSHYQRARALIDEKDDLAPVIHLNMAAALLELKRYPETVEEAAKALDGGANKEKAFYRLGCAAYGMRSWSEAIGHLESALAHNPKCHLAVQQLAKAKARLAESLTGKYDLRKLFDDDKQGQRHMDVANYIGPVKVADIPGKGKGLIATEDVAKGTLLLASKAYAIAFEKDRSPMQLQSVNVITKEITKRSQLICIIAAVQKLKREPQTAKELYGLYAGDGIERSMPTLDGVIDIARIERICSLNSFDPVDDHKNWPSSEAEEDSQLDVTGTGLWIMPSYANHSCLNNTHVSFFGDLMMIRAIADIKKGDEVTVNYRHRLTYKERNSYLTRRWGFSCDCRLCELDRQESPEMAKERMQLVREYIQEMQKQRQQQWSRPQAALAKLLPLVDRSRKTYENRREMQTNMVKPLQILAYVY